MKCFCGGEIYINPSTDVQTCDVCKFQFGNNETELKRLERYREYISQFIKVDDYIFIDNAKYKVYSKAHSFLAAESIKTGDQYTWNYEQVDWNPTWLAPDTITLKEGTKYDSNKLMMELIPDEALIGLASVLTYGATKYEAENWRKGIKYKRVLGAMMRHITAWKQGEINDPESGLPHLWHAIFGLAVLITYEAHPNYKSFNDLQQVPMAYKDLLNQAIEKAKEFKNGHTRS